MRIFSRRYLPISKELIDEFEMRIPGRTWFRALGNTLLHLGNTVSNEVNFFCGMYCLARKKFLEVLVVQS